MDKDTITAAVLLETAETQQRAVEAQQRQVAATLSSLQTFLGQLPEALKRVAPAVGQAVGNELVKEIGAARVELHRLAEEAATTRRWFHWQLWSMAAVCGIAAAATGAALLMWTVPSMTEIAQLRAEQAQLEASVADLTQRGGKMVLDQCGNPGEPKHLCVLIDHRMGRFSNGRSSGIYMIPQGY
jgi:hypothetical protein